MLKALHKINYYNVRADMRTKSGKKRQEILDAAESVFIELGFERTSMDEITARWGGSKTTVYSYFASKQELFIEVMDQLIHKHLTNIYDVFKPNADLTTTLQAFGELLLGVLSLKEIVLTRRIVYAEAAKHSLGKVFYEGVLFEQLKTLSKFIDGWMDMGLLGKSDSFVAAQHFIGLVTAESSDLLLLGVQETFNSEEISAMVKRAVRVFLNGYSGF